MYCCVRGCTSRYGKDIVSFHKFPKKNPERMQLWVQAVGRASEIDYDKSWVCGRHFVGGKAARPSENEEDNWVPTLYLSGGGGGGGGGHYRQHPVELDDDDEPTHFEDDFNVRCTVRGCQNTREENPSMLFFPIPTREPTRTIWLQRMGLQSAPVGGRGRPTPGVCELHFELTKDLQNYDEFITTGAAGVLKEGVILSRNIPVALDASQDASEVTTLDDDESLLEELVPGGDKSRNGQDESMAYFPDHMQPSPIEEFVQVCRSCLSTDKANLVTGLDDQLVEIFHQFTSISIRKGEGISTSFCQECRNRLLELHFFRDTCLTSTQILIHRYQKCYGITPDSDAEGDGDRSSFGNGSFASSSRLQNNATADDPEDLLMAQEEEPTDSYWGHKGGQSSGIKRRGRPPKHEADRTAKRMKQNHLKKRHSCKVCHKEYNSRAGIDMHMATHKDDDPAEFTVTCNKCPVLRRPGDKHTCYVNTVVCHVCSEPFNGWSYLKLHLGKVHKIKTKRHELMEKLKEKKADQLLRSPIKRFDISSIKSGGSTSSSAVTPKTTGKDAPEPYLKCNFCKAVYKHKPTLDAHLRTHASHELKECNECGEEFPNFRSLQKHHDEHTDHGTDEKAGLVNMCHLCGMQMNRRQTLLLHRQYVHRDPEVVKCDSCPRLFASVKRRAEHHCPAMGRKRHDSASNATSASASGRDSAASSSAGGGINGDFVIVKPESILKGMAPLDSDDEDARMDPMAGTQHQQQQGDNADPLLGLGNEDVIELESDEEEEEDDDSNQTGKSAVIFECNVCNKTFEKEDVLEWHMKLHRMMSAAKSNSGGLRK